MTAKDALKRLWTSTTYTLTFVGVLGVMFLIPKAWYPVLFDMDDPTVGEPIKGWAEFVFTVVMLAGLAYVMRGYVLRPLLALSKTTSVGDVIRQLKPLWRDCLISACLLTIPGAVTLVPDWSTPVLTVAFLGLIAMWEFVSRRRDRAVNALLPTFERT